MSDQDGNQTVKKKKFRGEVYIDIERCKGCGFCVEFCPTGTLALSQAFNAKGYHPPEVVDIETCTGCGLCGMFCPDFAIFGLRIRNEESSPNTPPADAPMRDEE